MNKLQYGRSLLDDLRIRKMQIEFHPQEFTRHVDHVLVRQASGEIALIFHMKCGLILTEYQTKYLNWQQK